MNGDPGKNKSVYRWTRKDMAQHLLPAIPLLVFYAGTVYLLAASSLFLHPSPPVLYQFRWEFEAGIPGRLSPPRRRGSSQRACDHSTPMAVTPAQAGVQAISASLDSRPRIHEGRLCAGMMAAS